MKTNRQSATWQACSTPLLLSRGDCALTIEEHSNELVLIANGVARKGLETIQRLGLPPLQGRKGTAEELQIVVY